MTDTYGVIPDIYTGDTGTMQLWQGNKLFATFAPLVCGELRRRSPGPGVSFPRVV